MSVIRFLHSDHLRLASPLSGLADCPDWLRRAAASAVRRSVVSLFETAAAARCDFLLIAGRLTESEQDLDAAVRWLLPHAEQLRGAGIQLVLTGYKRSEQAALLPLGAILCEPHDVIEVWKNPHNEIQHHVHAVRSYRDSSGHAAGLRRTDRSLWLENHTQNFETPERSNRAAGTGELRYVTVSGIKASPSPGAAGSERLSGETATGYSTARSLTVTAGAPQAVGPSEQGVFGCRIVEADTMHQTLTARFCETDTFRFVRETINSRQPMTSAGLVSKLAECSRSLTSTTGRTLVIDWVVDGLFQSENRRLGDLDETSLLKELRNQMQAGHSGIWPRRIQYSSDAAFTAAPGSSLAVQEFLKVSAERNNLHENTFASGTTELIRGRHSGADTVTGLNLLARVA